jgi:hypothetical protein
MRLISVTIFVMGAMTASLAYAINYTRRPNGFTMTSRQVHQPADGSPVLVAEIERYQKSDGSWRLTTTYYNADGTIRKVDNGFGQLGRGVFQVNEKAMRLNFISPMSPQAHVVSASDMRKDPNFVREESVLGYETFVSRQPGEDGAYAEVYRAPALQGMPIKIIFSSEAGTTVIEPIRIALGEPSEAVFTAMPDYQVNYEHFENKIQGIEESGQYETAKQMRQELQNIKSKKQ